MGDWPSFGGTSPANLHSGVQVITLGVVTRTTRGGTTAEQPGRAPRRDAAENRAALIEAAKRVLQQDPDAGLETIATAAGLSRRAVYGHFPSRDDLVREVVTGGAARIAGAMPDSSALGALPPAARLAALAVALWSEV